MVWKGLPAGTYHIHRDNIPRWSDCLHNKRSCDQKKKRWCLNGETNPYLDKKIPCIPIPVLLGHIDRSDNRLECFSLGSELPSGIILHTGNYYHPHCNSCYLLHPEAYQMVIRKEAANLRGIRSARYIQDTKTEIA